MALTQIPTKTEDSLGIEKSDNVPEGVTLDPRHYTTAAQLERMKSAIIALATDVGIDDPPAAGSLKAKVEALEGGVPEGGLSNDSFAGTHTGELRRTGAGTYAVARHELAASAAPTTGDDSADGYATGSLWQWIAEDPAAGVYYCADATEGAAQWVRIYPAEVDLPEIPALSDATPQALGTAASGTSPDAARADHVHAKPTSTTIGTTIETTSVSLTDLADGTVYQVNLGSPDVLSVGVSDDGAVVGKLVGFVPVGTGGVSVAAAGAMNLRYSADFSPAAAGQYSPIWVLILAPTEALVFGDLAAA